MSVDDVTVRAAIVLGLAVVALIATGWRKTVRAQTRLGRVDPERLTKLRAEGPRRLPIAIEEVPVEGYHRPGPLRRLWAAAASSGLAIVIGAAVATLVAFSLAFVVIVLTDLLKQ